MDIKNIGRTTTVRALLVGTGVLAAVAVVGCGAGQSAAGQNSAGANSPTVATSTSSGGTGSTGPMSTGAPSTSSTSLGGSVSADAANTVVAAHSSAIPECKSNTIALSFGGSDAGMSQQEVVLRFTNTGSQSCAIGGFPGVSYVAGDNGQQVGAPAVRTGTIGASITLGPGQVASTVIHSVQAGVFDPNVCKPTPVRGYRIYAPDDRASMFIALPNGGQGCAGTTPDPQLSVVTIKAGLGNPDQP
jgi:hypothetical protein